MEVSVQGQTAAAPARYEERTAAGFIYKSVSEDTRKAYRICLRDFFTFVEGIHPALVTPEHVIAFRDDMIGSGRKPATIMNKLAIIRSFFAHLQAGGTVTLNPASTKLVKPPRQGESTAGRALTPKEALHLLAGPDRSRPEGARDYALMHVMLRLGLRVAEVVSLRRTSLVWKGRWTLSCKVKGGREEVWPLPEDVRQAIEGYLRLDARRRSLVGSGGEDAPLFQPHSNFRTLVYDKPLSRRQVERIVSRWGDYTGLGKVTPHDLRRTVVTELLRRGHSYREVQMVTKHRDPKTVMRYDRARENLDSNPVNTFNYES
jgi:site-specific recombinase XerD